MGKIKLVFTSISTALAYVFGGMDKMLAILIIFMIIDFVSGFIKAWALKEFDSSKFYVGGVKKLGILLIVVLATQLDSLIHVDSVALRTVAISYYIANEGFSILENWGQLGLPLPKVLKNTLAKLKEEDNESK